MPSGPLNLCGVAARIVLKIDLLDEHMDPMPLLEYGAIAVEAAALCRRMAEAIPEGTSNAAIAFALAAMLATADEDWTAEVDG